MEQLVKFVKDNNLIFVDGSQGDINILALCGYATFIKATLEECIGVANNEDCNDEIRRIYEYAKNNNYAAFWSTDKAKKQYKF